MTLALVHPVLAADRQSEVVAAQAGERSARDVIGANAPIAERLRRVPCAGA